MLEFVLGVLIGGIIGAFVLLMIITDFNIDDLDEGGY